MTQKIKRLLCACCGAPLMGRQHWNQDTGYGLCDPCVPFVSRNTSQEEVEEAYGKPGIHYLITDEEKHEPKKATRR